MIDLTIFPVDTKTGGAFVLNIIITQVRFLPHRTEELARKIWSGRFPFFVEKQVNLSAKKEMPNYCIDEFWPENEKQDELLAYDQQAKPFHIGQCYEESKAMTLKCYKCGGNKFHVAQGSCYTAIRCVICMWECCIHEG
jgi:hypothetical protein